MNPDFPNTLSERVLKVGLPWWRKRPDCGFWRNLNDRKRPACATMYF
jgi:hypothetical protein